MTDPVQEVILDLPGEARSRISADFNLATEAASQEKLALRKPISPVDRPYHK